eukprot:GHVN01097124.1.p1 GENE.GHVN01097124.1~~GHVN01097124.1.p1  ORF type:complete len:241 (-),score=17.53 GHVN01097124.1:1553-2275(-)
MKVSALILLSLGKSVLAAGYYNNYPNTLPNGPMSHGPPMHGAMSHGPVPHAPPPMPSYVTKEWGPPIIIPPKQKKQHTPKAAPVFSTPHQHNKKHQQLPPVMHNTKTNENIYRDKSVDVHVNVLNSVIPSQNQNQGQMQAQGSRMQPMMGMQPSLGGGRGQGGQGGMRQGGGRPPAQLQQRPTQGPPPVGRAQSGPDAQYGEVSHTYGLPWMKAGHVQNWPTSNCKGKSCLTLNRILRSS